MAASNHSLNDALPAGGDTTTPEVLSVGELHTFDTARA